MAGQLFEGLDRARACLHATVAFGGEIVLGKERILQVGRMLCGRTTDKRKDGM